jgi:lipopolysaccharide/colanic/teichoic acid biosynthesis glycosyltransferase
MKRAFDLVSAVLGLLLTSPVMLIAGIAVKIDSAGPVFFRQERVGQNGRRIRVVKFRSMVFDAAGPAVTSASDPRVTRAGKWLRASKVDELPQFFNVLVGDMSLVGPRPEVPRYVELWGSAAQSEILSVRPGITDPASVAFRRESEILAEAADPEHLYREVILPAKVNIYRNYVATRSLVGDLRIIGQTLKTVLKD